MVFGTIGGVVKPVADNGVPMAMVFGTIGGVVKPVADSGVTMAIVLGDTILSPVAGRGVVVVMLLPGAANVPACAPTASANIFVLARCVESVTLTMKENFPLAAGIPDNTPAGDKVRPAGRWPPITDQV
jgi:hypothetical protein